MVIQKIRCCTFPQICLNNAFLHFWFGIIRAFVNTWFFLFPRDSQIQLWLALFLQSLMRCLGHSFVISLRRRNRCMNWCHVLWYCIFVKINIIQRGKYIRYRPIIHWLFLLGFSSKIIRLVLLWLEPHLFQNYFLVLS